MWVNTELFRTEAKNFLKYGRYCDYQPGTPGWFDYWSTQLDYCINGFSVGDQHITGDHYGYLNFAQIKLTEETSLIENVTKNRVRKGTKVTTFPDFWDGDLMFFNALEEAREKGKHLTIAKARRKGYSYKNGWICTNRYNTIRGATSLIGAADKKYLYPQGTMTMVSDYMDFLNSQTAWAKRRSINKIDHKRAGYFETINGVLVEKGYKSQVIAVTFKDNPDAARGKDATLILFEEAGAFDNLKQSLMATRPTVEDGVMVTGQIVLFGTGGDMMAGTIDFESIFYNPEPYNMMTFENVWDEGARGTSCGFFHPVYMNKVGFMDKDGNSLVEQAKAFEEETRKKIKEESKDPGLIDRYTTEYPMNPREAFMQVHSNLFPVAMLTEHRNHIMTTGLVKNMGTAGFLEPVGDSIKFRPSITAHPIMKYPHDKADDLTGCVVIYQAPFRDANGDVPPNLYFITHDPYGIDTEFGKSLGATYVIKRVNSVSKPDDMIVASYVGRPGMQDEYNDTMFMLSEYYNAKIGFENDRGDVVGYARRMHKLGQLLGEVEIVDKRENVHIRRLGRTFGTSMGSEQRKSQAEIYLRDWLLSPRGVLEDGTKQFNLHKIYDVALLDELIKFNRKRGNFDRVSALLVGMFYMQDLHNREVETAEERVTESFWDRDFF